MRKGFTLIELMVAVSVLSIGIVLILRSFLTASSALDLTQNRIKAIQLLEARLNELELIEKEKGCISIKADGISEPVTINNRSAQLSISIQPLAVDEFKEKEDLNEIKLTVLWSEANKKREQILTTYLKNKLE